MSTDNPTTDTAHVRLSIQDEAAYWPAGTTPEQRKLAEDTLRELTDVDCQSATLAKLAATVFDEPASLIVTFPTAEAAAAYRRNHLEPAVRVTRSDGLLHAKAAWQPKYSRDETDATGDEP